MSNEDLRPGAPVGSSGEKFDVGDVTAVLEKMLASPSFARSPRLQAFLRYIVSVRLAGREDSPKEYELGTRIFERAATFDPQSDPIVRVQARQLRFKLREYYAAGGADDRLRIDLPKGTYLPTLTYALPLAAVAPPATALPAQTPDDGAASEEPSDPPPPDAHTPSRWWGARWLVWLLIAGALPLLLLAIRREVVPRAIVPYRPDPQAHALYQEGRYYWNQRSPQALYKAVDDFTQATNLDPNYAQAYVGLADSYNLLHEYAAMPASEAFSRATRAAQRAVELDDNSAEARSALAFDLFWGAWDTAGSEREFRKALTLDPNYARAHHWYATSLMAQGRLTDAAKEMEMARELDPTSPSVIADNAIILFEMGRYSDAVAVLHELETNDPSFVSPHRYLALIAKCTGDDRAYMAELQQQATLSTDPAAETIAEAARSGFKSGGRKGMLEQVLQAQMDLYKRGQVTAYEVAESFALLGDSQDALHYLRIAYERHESNMVALPSECTLRSLRKEPAFQDLLVRMHEVQRQGGYTSKPR